MTNSLAIGKLQAALASATNEVTVAAANINFDFTLVKCEPPPEYQPLGREISSWRKAEAEGGSQHVTARRLTALFEEFCPQTRRLISAYGTRASEICEACSHANSFNVRNWIFSDYTGVDATSLWAAATSSRAAIPVYLLACMIARAWGDADATSIWVEIVDDRRRDVATRFENGEAMPFAVTAAAVQQEITRDELARWDASARAWIKTADEHMSRQRRQFLLVANNIDIPVNDEHKPYHSIIQAWVSALQTMEKLMRGEPHAVTNGSVLLAISAWHIYPDMMVFGEGCNKAVGMEDSLVHPGGIVSLGMTDTAPRVSRGIYWSLSLGHHRFYGRPTRRTTKTNENGSRVTFAELQIAVVGTILSKWQIPPEDTEMALRFLLQIASHLPYSPLNTTDKWINMLVQPIMRFFDDTKSALPLISLGRRRKAFIPPREDGQEHPFFGLVRLNSILSLMETSDNRIECLRRLSGRVQGLESTMALIVFRDNDDWHLASVFPVITIYNKPVSILKPVSTSRSKRGPTHCRWMASSGGNAGEKLKQERILSLSLLKFERLRTWFNIGSLDQEYEFLFGDPDIAAVFTCKTLNQTQSFVPVLQPPSLSYEDILWCISHDLVSASAIKKEILSSDSPILHSLVDLAFASDVYEGLSQDGATISTQVLQGTFRINEGRLWVEERDWTYDQEDKPNTVAKTLRDSPSTLIFAMEVIVLFETGMNLPRGEISASRILGMAVGDSIYVPKKLLEDPSSSRRPHEWSRLLGSLGRPGLTILTSPERPEVRDLDIGTWRKASIEFDGDQEDCFASTSLHLSFTEWSVPLYRENAIGQRSSEAVHVEAVVSVRDSGCWVADVDILRAMEAASVQCVPALSTPCLQSHSEPGKKCRQIIALETWDQVLDCPEGLSVTRSSNNWVARLALVSVLANHCTLEGHRIFVASNSACWECIRETDIRNAIYIS